MKKKNHSIEICGHHTINNTIKNNYLYINYIIMWLLKV